MMDPKTTPERRPQPPRVTPSHPRARSRPRHRYQVGEAAADRLIDELAKYAASEQQPLLREILTTAVKIGQDRLETGDLKVLNTTLKELRYSFKVFSQYRHVRKVAIFGSARAERHSPEYRMAEAFAKAIVQRGFMVITGAASGIMEAGNKGAGEEKSFGVNIRLPFEQEANPFIDESPRLINFKYFFNRKLVFIKESDATILFPGGFGTHDEGFETLTLVQTGKTTPRPIILAEPADSTYWKDWQRFIRDHLIATHYLDPTDLTLFSTAQSVHDAVRLIETFYRIYHSIRYVGDWTVLRVTQPVPPHVVAELNEQFRELLVEGAITTSAALEEEVRDQDYVDLPRLIMKFNRRDFGRLRALIDCLNQRVGV